MADFSRGKTWMVVSAVLALVAGCVSERKSATAEIEKARTDGHVGTSMDSRRVDESIFFVITTDHRIDWQSVSRRGTQWYTALEDVLEHGDPLRTSYGLAFAIDPNGYLLTAGHCLIDGSHTYLLGRIDGKAVVFKPRVVAKLVRKEPGAEYALLVVPRKLDAWLKPGPMPLPDEPVVAVSWLTDPEGEKIERGSVVAVRRYEDAPELATVETTLPLGHGDSGAPLLTEDGRVVGVNVGGYRGNRVNGKVYTGGRWRGQSLACVPGWDELKKRIRDDEPARRLDEKADRTPIEGPDMDEANLRILRMGPSGHR